MTSFYFLLSNFNQHNILYESTCLRWQVTFLAKGGNILEYEIYSS